MKKNLKKIFIIILLVMITLPTQLIQVLAVEIGDTTYLERGDLGFYTVQFDKNGIWTYITYDIVKYVDKDGNRRVAYCLNRELNGVGWTSGDVEGYDVDIVKLLENVELWRVYINGYPYVTPEQLGVETEEDAYLATKHAGYWVIQGNSLEEIKNYYRPGQTSINGQNLEDIKRRGEKVINAIYYLVDKAYNDSTTPETADIISINKIGNFIQDSNNEYYSQKYSVSSKTAISQYTVKSFAGFPEGTYIANLDGENKETFGDGEQFKIMIPKSSITNNISGTIYVQGKCLTYPVYYGASRDGNYQNYAIITDPYGDYSASINLDINAYKSVLKIIKTDEETGKKLSGVTFNAKYEDNSNIGDFTTNSDGIINITGLKQGKIILTEIKTQDQYILNTNAKEVTIGYNESKTIDITNMHKNGNLKIYKVDLDNNKIPVPDVEFEIIDQDGYKYNAKSDKDGIAYIENIRTGIATIKEIKTNKIYKLSANTYNAQIKWNETSEITIKNEKLKGQIRIIKVDKDNNEVKLEGVTFDILDESKNIVDTVITDKNGVATTKKLAIDQKYTVIEKSTRNEYVLTQESQTITLKEDEITTITFKNEKKKGQIRIIKVDKDNNEVKLEGVTFDILDESKNIVDTVITDKNGVATTKKLAIDQKYTVVEKSTKNEYVLTEETKIVTLKENEIISITFQNEKKKGQIKIIKVDAQNNEVKLKEVEFQIIDKNNNIVETIKTDKNGEAKTSRLPLGDYKIKEVSLGTNKEYILNEEVKTITVEENKIKTIQFENEHKKGNLKIYKVDLDNNKIPVPDVEFEITDQDGYKYSAKSDNKGIAYIENIRTGIANIKEIKTNKIYKLSDDTYNAEIKWNETSEITIKNEKLKGQIEVYKVDEENKEYKLEGVEFQIINSNNKIVETIKTDKNGYAITSRIPIGEYKLKEVKTDSMHILNDEIIKVNVSSDIVSKLEITNKRIKGQIKIIKTSKDDNFINNKTAGEPIENVEFEIYDSNKKLVDTIKTNEQGIAITKKLDKGSYTIKESKSGKWYLLNEEEFFAVINKNEEIIEISIENESEKPSVHIEKTGIIQTTANQEIRYDFKIKNTGNVSLDKFTWFDYLPTEYLKITKLITGKYNQDLNYRIYYKTNLNEYRLLVENLNTQINNYIDFSNIQLEEGEVITEFKLDFGTVNEGFESVINPYIFVNVNSKVESDDTFTNKTRIEGDNKGFLVWDEDEHTTTVYKKEINVKKLPRTGC